MSYIFVEKLDIFSSIPMIDNSNQILFLKKLGTLLPPKVNVANVLQEVLDISPSAAYKRISGETPLTIIELEKISTKFNIGIDSFINQNLVSFSYKGIQEEGHTFKNWLMALEVQLNLAISKNITCLYYDAKEIPLFYNFLCPELAWFKTYFWQKVMFSFDSMKKIKFSLDDIDEEICEQGKRLFLCYQKIPTVEIWNQETIHVMFRQVQYCLKSGFFENPAHAEVLIKKMESLIEFIREQANNGYKLMDDGSLTNTPYELYNNEFILGDNSVLLEIPGVSFLFHTGNPLRTVQTITDHYIDDYKKSLKTMILKSTKISTENQSARDEFFTIILNKVDSFSKTILGK